ncbi:FmdB family zinc ribbon protein [Desulfovibrio cuneatus]|uniref:FmdB family zinc ribbon protein n=1 Tax=Desulfovibrio cuneatus TaxID=159728 RepID=UPI000416E8E1|nr:zinc ribbon domain-containing protein [Desulfovibrio cuneatus]
MPIYEYRCNDCQQIFEEWCKHVEPQEATHPCPICHGTSQRIMSQTSFALKGEGWYVTEYGSHKNAPKENAASPAAEAPAASTDASAPAAPAPAVVPAAPVAKAEAPAKATPAT